MALPRRPFSAGKGSPERIVEVTAVRRTSTARRHGGHGASSANKRSPTGSPMPFGFRCLDPDAESLGPAIYWKEECSAANAITPHRRRVFEVQQELSLTLSLSQDSTDTREKVSSSSTASFSIGLRTSRTNSMLSSPLRGPLQPPVLGEAQSMTAAAVAEIVAEGVALASPKAAGEEASQRGALRKRPLSPIDVENDDIEAEDRSQGREDEDEYPNAAEASLAFRQRLQPSPTGWEAANRIDAFNEEAYASSQNLGSLSRSSSEGGLQEVVADPEVVAAKKAERAKRVAEEARKRDITPRTLPPFRNKRHDARDRMQQRRSSSVERGLT